MPKRPDGQSALHFGVLLRKGYGRKRRRHVVAWPKERKKIAKQFPNAVDYEGKLAFRQFLRRTLPCPF
jgi:hypothetical protein